MYGVLAFISMPGLVVPPLALAVALLAAHAADRRLRPREGPGGGS